MLELTAGSGVIDVGYEHSTHRTACRSQRMLALNIIEIVQNATMVRLGRRASDQPFSSHKCHLRRGEINGLAYLHTTRSSHEQCKSEC
jgi:hypothetical protein